MIQLHKYISLLINIFLVLVVIKLLKNKENFTITNDDETKIRSIIKDIYSSDLDAIRTLASMAQKIQEGGFTVNGNLKITGRLDVGGDIANNWITNTLSTFNNTMNSRLGKIEDKTGKLQDHMYYPGQAIIYDNITTLINNNTNTSVKKNGNPSGWNSTSYPSSNKWSDKEIVYLGKDNVYPNGIQIFVPSGHNTIWVQALRDEYSERWPIFQIFTGNGTSICKFAANRKYDLTAIDPDGGMANVNLNFIWIPCSVPDDNSYYYIIGINESWIGGLATSPNPWYHSMMNALSVHWKYNGSSGIDWNNENWNGGNLTNQSPNTTAIIYIPIVRSGRDKLLYFNEHNDTNNYGVYLSITVNDNNIERLRTSYDNPFSRHFNSKPYCRFLAARVPAQYLGNENFVKVTFKTVTQVTYFHFRECGLIDYYP